MSNEIRLDASSSELCAKGRPSIMKARTNGRYLLSVLLTISICCEAERQVRGHVQSISVGL